MNRARPSPPAVVAAPQSTSNQANARPISSKTRRLPRATATLARSNAAAGSRICQTDASGASSGTLAPSLPASVATWLAARSASGDDRNAASAARWRSSLRIVRPACFEAHVA